MLMAGLKNMEHESAKRTYRLYAMPPTWEAIEIAMSEKYSRVTPTPSPGYVLIYSDGDAPKGAQEITAEESERLTSADVKWLVECGANILAEEAAKETPYAMESISERIEALEAELKRKKQELSDVLPPRATG